MRLQTTSRVFRLACVLLATFGLLCRPFFSSIMAKYYKRPISSMKWKGITCSLWGTRPLRTRPLETVKRRCLSATPILKAHGSIGVRGRSIRRAGRKKHRGEGSCKRNKNHAMR